MLDSLLWIHIEDNSTGTSPTAILKMKDRAAVANGTHRFNVLHIATFDRIKANVDGRESADQAVVFVRDNQQLVGPFTGDPAKPSGFSRPRCQRKEVLLKVPFKSLKLRDGVSVARDG